MALYNMAARRRDEVALDRSRSDVDEFRQRYAREAARSKVRLRAMSTIHEAIHDLRDQVWRFGTRDTSPKEKMADLAHVLYTILDKVARTTSDLAGSMCAACVKVFIDEKGKDGQHLLLTLSRDDASARRRGQQDREETFTVAGNYDFDWIMNKGNRSFFSNNLPVDEANGKYWNERADYAKFYKSAVVLPIQRSRLPGEPEHYHDICGFLCVDSPATGVFDEDEVVALLAPIADSMYVPLAVERPFEKEVPRG